MNLPRKGMELRKPIWNYSVQKISFRDASLAFPKLKF